MHSYILKLESILTRANVCASHGLQHAIAVKDHALYATRADVNIRNDPNLVSNKLFVSNINYYNNILFRRLS